jgi:hypothetical protein
MAEITDTVRELESCSLSETMTEALAVLGMAARDGMAIGEPLLSCPYQLEFKTATKSGLY